MHTYINTELHMKIKMRHKITVLIISINRTKGVIQKEFFHCYFKLFTAGE